MKFRICYTSQDGKRSVIYNSDRFLIDTHGRIYENYGKDWKCPVWETPFDVAFPPIIQYFTGLTDKNDEDIYEGDTVVYNGRTGMVQFFAGAFIVDWGDQTDDILSYMQKNDVELIGNIFEV